MVTWVLSFWCLAALVSEHQEMALQELGLGVLGVAG